MRWEGKITHIQTHVSKHFSLRLITQPLGCPKHTSYLLLFCILGAAAAFPSWHCNVRALCWGGVIYGVPRAEWLPREGWVTAASVSPLLSSSLLSFPFVTSLPSPFLIHPFSFLAFSSPSPSLPLSPSSQARRVELLWPGRSVVFIRTVLKDIHGVWCCVPASSSSLSSSAAHKSSDPTLSLLSLPLLPSLPSSLSYHVLFLVSLASLLLE